MVECPSENGEPELCSRPPRTEGTLVCATLTDEAIDELGLRKYGYTPGTSCRCTGMYGWAARKGVFMPIKAESTHHCAVNYLLEGYKDAVTDMDDTDSYSTACNA